MIIEALERDISRKCKAASGSTMCPLITVVDCYSRHPQVMMLITTTSLSVISAHKAIFARYSNPKEVRGDNGPQSDSDDFATFSKSHSFHHCPSSPHFPQSNSLVEEAVNTVKELLKRSVDPYLALLSYKATTLH